MTIPVVMHYRSTIVWDTIGLKVWHQFEIDVRALRNVTPIDCNILIAIRTVLDMPNSQSVGEFVLNGVGILAIGIRLQLTSLGSSP